MTTNEIQSETSAEIHAIFTEALEELHADPLDLPCVFVDCGRVRDGYLKIPTDSDGRIEFAHAYSDHYGNHAYIRVPGDITAAELASIIDDPDSRPLIERIIAGDASDSECDDLETLIVDALARSAYETWDVAEWLQRSDIVHECVCKGVQTYINEVAEAAKREKVILWCGDGLPALNRAAIDEHVRETLAEAREDAEED